MGAGMRAESLTPPATVRCVTALFGGFFGLFVVCCSPAAVDSTPAAPGQTAGSASAQARASNNASGAPTDAAASTGSRPDSSLPAQPDPSTLSEERRRAIGLPEVVVENIGLHIGGGPNTPVAKEPFLSAVAKRFRSFRLCYAKSNDPQAGGVFGVDLRIAREGGRPEVSEPRTRMGGPEFRACVLDVFRTVSFERLDQPTVISYSMRFTLLDRTSPQRE
jgi:hypothetical protein